MARYSKAFILALAMVSALSAGLSASASAKQQFHSETEETTITGSTKEKHTFNFGATSVVCSSSKFEATLTSKTSSELTMTPTYENCFIEPFEKVPVGVNMNGCDYLVTFREEAPTTQVHLKCPSAAGIHFNVGECEIEIAPQTLAGYSFQNTGEGMFRDFDMIETEVLFAFTAGGKNCKGGAGKMSGKTTISGENSKGESMGIWVE